MASASLSYILDRFKISIGAWLVGTFITALLVGMLLQQTFRYFRLYPKESWLMKCWVIAAVVLQLFTTAMIMYTSYDYLVTHYLDPAVFLGRNIWSSGTVPLIGALGNLVCESFFARRVYMIGPRYRVVVFSAMAMILTSCGFFVALAVQVYTSDASSASPFSGWLPTSASVLLLAGDVQLTAVLVYVLHQGRSGIRRTDSMVDLLIAYAISTGSLICILNVASLVVCVVFPHDVIFSASTLVLQAVYTNSFVVALNTRASVRSRGELDHTNLGTGIVLGEKGPSGTAVDQPLASMVFAVGRSQSQVMGTELNC